MGESLRRLRPRPRPHVHGHFHRPASVVLALAAAHGARRGVLPHCGRDRVYAE